MEYDSVNLSLLKNPTLLFDNTVGATKENINIPITYKDCVVGIVIDVTEDKIYCKIWDKFIRFYPEYNSPDGINTFKLFGIDISLPNDKIKNLI